MKIVFLGSASCYPTPSRGVSCTALQQDDGSVWIFDCGEGSQIQVQRSCIKPGKITKIFITHLHGDHLFGLPGLLCTMGNGQDPEKAKNVTVELYGPLGLRKYVTTSLSLSRSPLVFRIVVHELVPREDQYPQDWNSWRVEHDMSESPLPQEKTHARIGYNPDSLSWECFRDNVFTVKAVALKHRIPSFGYLVTEKNSPGRLNTDKLTEMGIMPGPIYGKLKSGQSVTLDNGTVLSPSEYLGAPVSGRSVAVMGDTCDSSELANIVTGRLDVLVHEATMENKLHDKCVEFGHSTPAMAAQLAHSVKADTLILFHVSPRYRPISMCDDTNKHESAQILLDEAREHLKSVPNCDTKVLIAEDFTEFTIAKHK